MNNATPRSDTPTLIAEMWILARDIQSEDGVANAAIAEAAMRLEELNGSAGQSVTIRPEDQILVTCAVRYALPRKTYVVHVCARWVIENWERFTPQTRQCIQKDVERELKDTGMMDMDRKEWEAVAALWREENKDSAS